MSISRRVMTISDLHQRASLFEQLQEAIARERPDVLALVGDILDGCEPLPAGCLREEEIALLLADFPCEVVFVRGNHESFRWTAFEIAWHATTRPLHALHGTAVAFGPLVIVGFPCFLGDDFAYSEGRRLPEYTYEEWLPTILQENGAAGRTLWLMHEPPDPALAAQWACEPSWGQAVDEYQPRLTVSGHDHDIPLSTGRWHVSRGATVCINAGQRVDPEPGKLIYCLLNLEFPKESPCLPQLVEFRKLSYT